MNKCNFVTHQLPKLTQTKRKSDIFVEAMKKESGQTDAVNELPYIHRDVSWLSFNYRVLQEAKDPNVPLLERIKFLAIYSSNLGEFFRVRIANHRNVMRASKKSRKKLGYKSSSVLKELLKIIYEQLLEFSSIFENQIIPELKEHKINLLTRKGLNEKQLTFIEEFYMDNLLPFVQPVFLDKHKIKPFLQSGSLYLILHMEDKEDPLKLPKYAIVNIPSNHVKRFLELPPKVKGEHDIIMLDDIVRHSIQSIFPGFNILDTYSIKVTRDAELYIDDEYAGNLVNKIRKSLKKRKVGVASRLVFDREVPSHLLEYFKEVLDLTKYDLLPEGRYHNNFDFFSFPDFGFKHLKDKKLSPVHYKALENAASIFDKIKEKDYLVHVPYHTFESVIKFFEDASVDPDVSEIKIIQYRVGSKSRIMKALMKAVKNGKKVSSFIEVKARFDEEANLDWGEKLEAAGVEVSYSMPGLKVHSKMANVIRKENGKEVIYTYLGTGNFHEGTATLYSDIGLLTANQELGHECVNLYNYLDTKEPPKLPFKHLAVGQFNLNDQLHTLVNFEIEQAKKGMKAEIILKMNSLQDKEMINRLYIASQAGVHVKLIIRGICSLVPGIQGISDNISVVSIVDRYLEHARIFVFHAAGKKKTYGSSADWMYRNLHARIETMFPIYDKTCKSIIHKLLELQLNDNVKARLIDETQSNTYRKAEPGEKAIRSQIETYNYIQQITD